MAIVESKDEKWYEVGVYEQCKGVGGGARYVVWEERLDRDFADLEKFVLPIFWKDYTLLNRALCHESHVGQEIRRQEWIFRASRRGRMD